MELILKEAALDILKDLPTNEKEEKIVNRLYAAINMLPAQIDLEKVIRCADCKYRAYHVEYRYNKRGVICMCSLRNEQVDDIHGYCHLAEPFNGSR